MNCPRCGAVQPFEFKCVKCDADLAGNFPGGKPAVRFYQIAVISLLILIVWMVVPRSSPPPTEPSVDEALEALASPVPKRERLRILAPQPGRENQVANATLLVLYSKSELLGFQVVSGLRSSLRQKITPWDIAQDGLPPYSENTVVAAVGSEAVSRVRQARLDQPVFLLAPEENLESVINTREKIFGIQTKLPSDYEMVLLHQLFPEATNFVFVSPDSERRPSSSLVREMNVEITAVTPDAALLERELNTAADKRIIWFHHLPPEQWENFADSPRLENEVVIVGLPPPGADRDSSPAEEGAILPDRPLLALKLSPEGVATQAASQIRKVFLGVEISGIDIYPRSALVLEVNWPRVQAYNRQDWLEAVRQRAQRAGFQTRLAP